MDPNYDMMIPQIPQVSQKTDTRKWIIITIIVIVILLIVLLIAAAAFRMMGEDIPVTTT